MRSFLRNLIVFLIPIVILAGSLEFYLRNRMNTNEILAKLELVKKHSDTEMIFVGNSHGRNAFLPEQFDQKALNLCIGGSTPFYNAALVERVIEDLPNLKYIVYNLSYQSLYYDLDSLPDNKKKYEFFHYLGADCGVNKYTQDYFSLVTTIGLAKSIDNILRDFTSQTEDWIKTHGFKWEEEKIDVSNVEQSSKNRINAHHHLMSAQKLEFNLNQLANTEKIAAENSVKVIYVILPVLEEYDALMKPPFIEFRNEIKKYTQGDESAFYDMTRIPKLDITDFADPDHVNVHGARKISDFLSNRIHKKN